MTTNNIEKLSNINPSETTTASTSYDTYSTLSRGFLTPVVKWDVLHDTADRLHGWTGRPKSVPIRTNNGNANEELSEYQWTFEIKRLAMLSLIQKAIPEFDDEKEGEEHKVNNKNDHYGDNEYEDNISEFRRSSLGRSQDEDITSSIGWDICAIHGHNPTPPLNATGGVESIDLDYDLSFEVEIGDVPVENCDNQITGLTSQMRIEEIICDNDDQQFIFDDI